MMKQLKFSNMKVFKINFLLALSILIALASGCKVDTLEPLEKNANAMKFTASYLRSDCIGYADKSEINFLNTSFPKPNKQS